MGAYWLPELPNWLAAAGLNVRTWEGWETRCRSSGGYDAIYGVIPHHTASDTEPDNDCNWMWSNPANENGPVGAMLLDRGGRVTVGAAGATNCAGKGGPWTTSKGTVPLDKGNAYTVSIEAANAGTGETWPTVMLEAYTLLVATLCARLGLDPATDVAAHFEWAPARKIDPAGPPRYASGGDSWDMTQFRTDVLDLADCPTPPDPDPDPDLGDDDMLYIAKRTTGTVVVGNGVNALDLTDEHAATLDAQIGFGRWHHPHRAGYPSCTTVAAIVQLPDHQIDMLVGRTQ